MQGEPFTHQVGGEAMAKKHKARYTAIYDIYSPHVLMSPEWRGRARRAAGRKRW
jgi:hypothetical protein